MRTKNSQQEIATPVPDTVRSIQETDKAKRRTWTSRDTKRIVYAALMAAICVALKALSYPIVPTYRLTLVYVGYFCCGAFLGPFFGFPVCMLADFLGFIANPALQTGPYNLAMGLGYGTVGFIAGACVRYIPRLPFTAKLIIGGIISVITVTFFYSGWSAYVVGTPFPTQSQYAANLSSRIGAVVVAVANLIITVPVAIALKRTAFKDNPFVKPKT